MASKIIDNKIKGLQNSSHQTTDDIRIRFDFIKLLLNVQRLRALPTLIFHP